MNIRKIKQRATKPSTAKKGRLAEGRHRVITDPKEAIRRIKGYVTKGVPVAVDTETFGATIAGVERSALSLRYSRLLTIQCWSGELGEDGNPRADVYVFREMHPDGMRVAEIREAWNKFADSGVPFVFHNANYDLNALANHGLMHPREWHCTMLAGLAYNEEIPASLKERAALIGMLLQPTKKINFKDLEELADYGGDDAVATLKLYRLYYGTPGERLKVKGVYVRKKGEPGVLQGRRKDFYEKQEKPLLNILVPVQRHGIRVDAKKLAEIDAQISRDKAKHLANVNKYAGKQINLNSTKQLGEFLYDKLELECPEDCHTKTGAPSTNARTLFYLKGKHPVIEELLEYRALEKLQSTYTSPEKGLAAHMDAHGFIYATANQYGAKTSRFSYSNPNLQQIPSKTDRYGIRDCFIAPDGYVMAVFDYSQIEVRMQCMFSRARLLIEELGSKSGDVYLRTANEFGSSNPQDERRFYKVVVLALQYGMGPWKLSDNLTLQGHPADSHQARKIIDRYFGQVYPEIPMMWHALFQEHKRNGFVMNLCGRPRKVEGFETAFDPNSGRFGLNATERQLVNNIMQGSAADWIKQAMLRIAHSNKLRLTGYRMALQVHDELVGIIPEKRQHHFVHVMKEAEKAPGGLFAPTREIVVPVRAEGMTGRTWKECH